MCDKVDYMWTIWDKNVYKWQYWSIGGDDKNISTERRKVTLLYNVQHLEILKIYM